MRDERLSLEDRAHKLVKAHKEWILDEMEANRDADLLDGAVPMLDELVDGTVYGYLESNASPLRDVVLLADELDPETRIYTDDFYNAISVAVEKLLL